MQRWRRERRARGDRGSALIEAAFVFPVVIILVMGIVEVGYLFRSASLDSAASRAGARVFSAQFGGAYGDTSQGLVVANAAAASVTTELLTRGTTDTPLTLWIFKTDGSGNPLDATCTTECFKYTWSSGTSSFGTTPVGTWSDQDACGVTLDYIGVQLVARHTALVAPASLSVNSITQKTVMRLEPRTGCTSAEGPS